MEFRGRHIVPAPPEAVWQALTDPTVLRECIPGCRSAVRESPTRYAIEAAVKAGPIRAVVAARIALTCLDVPRRFTLRGQGAGGIAGFFQGVMTATLAADGDGTVLAYRARARLGGRLAGLGQGAIDRAAHRIARGFFSNFAARLMAQKALEVQTEIQAEPLAEALVAEELARREGLTPEVWVVGLILLTIILLLLFGVTL